MQQPNPYFIFKLMGCLLLLFCGNVFGQSFTYPIIKKQSKNIADVIPDGWQLLDSAKGCLNKDMYKDLALVLQHKDSVNNFDNEVDASIFARPRILVILFFDPIQYKYDLAAQSNSFILVDYDPHLVDPYQGISIKNHILKIEFGVFYSIGSWNMSHSAYEFYYQNCEFILIKGHYSEMHRAFGDFVERDFNFLTKKIKISEGNMKYAKEKVIWKTINVNCFKTLKTFLKPYTWDFEGYFLFEERPSLIRDCYLQEPLSTKSIIPSQSKSSG